MEQVFAARQRLIDIGKQQGWNLVDQDRLVSRSLPLPGWFHVGTALGRLGLKMAIGSGWVATSEVERNAIKEVLPTIHTQDLFHVVRQRSGDTLGGFAVSTAFLFTDPDHLDGVLPTYVEHMSASMRQAAGAVVDRVAQDLRSITGGWRPYVEALANLARHPDFEFVARPDAESATLIHRATGRPTLLERDDDGGLVVLSWAVGAEGHRLTDGDKAVVRAMADLLAENPGVNVLEASGPLGEGYAFVSQLGTNPDPDRKSVV